MTTIETDHEEWEYDETVIPREIRLSDFSDTSLANLFLSEHADVLLHVNEWGSWLVWNGTHWEPNAKRVDRLFQATVARQEKRLLDGLAAADDDSRKGWEAVLRQLRTFKNSSRIKAALERAAQSELVEAQASDMDTQHFLLNVLNGTIDLRTGRLQEHNPGDRITKLLRIEYDPKATCPVWERSLKTWMDDDASVLQFIQKAIGYTLTGSTRETCLFFTHGNGRTGKSTMTGCIQELLGEYAMTGADDLLTNRNGVRPDDIAALLGMRMVIAPEIEDSRKFSEADVKRLTSADRLNARRLYERPFTFTPTHKLWLTGNHLPIVKGSDEGIWRRMRVIPFDHRIADSEIDLALDEKLRKEHAGILAWAVRGCVAWYKLGLQTPERVAEATAAYRKDMDDVGAFLEEHVEQSEGSFIPAQDLYVRYQHWCQDQGIKVGRTQIALGRELESRGWEKKKVSSFRWMGYKLRPVFSSDSEQKGPGF